LQAVVLDAPRTLRLRERPEPEAGPGEVVIRIAGVGICGTDLGIFAGRVPVRHPLVLGHEMTGTVVSTGSPWPAGTRVVVDPQLYCGSCYQCVRGQTNVCARAELMGRERDGAFTELLSVPEHNVYELPPGLDERLAPLIQVVAVCVHAQRQTPIFPQESVLVFGLGVTGLLHVQLAKTRGAAPVVGVTRSPAKRALAERLGADVTLDAADPGLDDAVRAATGGRGPDVVIECVGKVETLARCIELVRVGGRLSLFGTVTAAEGALPFYQLYYKEIALANPRSAKPEDFPDSINLVASGALDLTPLVTHAFPLRAAEEALIVSARSDSLKVFIEVEGAT
jgi:L-iditol 2-dehydrogenase